MNLRLKLLLCFTCSLCRIGGCLGFNVSAADIADTWQSSWFNSDGCFRSSSARQGHWSYFHSSGTPDPSGYQWLLLKLTRCVRVRFVTVYGRPKAPAAERVRAQGIEVLLSDKKPAGLTENPPACTASFNHSLTGFRPCGVTKNSGSSDLAHEVTCSVRDYSKLTQFVLLRKSVANQTDRYMNFRLLEIEEDEEYGVFNRISNAIDDQGDRNESACYRAYFCKQVNKTSCSVRELSRLQQNDKLMIRAWLPCKLTEPGAPNCSIRMRNGGAMALSIKVETPSFLILSEFSVSSEMDGATLQCRHSCSDGAPGETSQVLWMQGCNSDKTLSSVRINLNVTKHWVVGQTAVLKVSSESSTALPKHECYLQYLKVETNGQDTAADVPLEQLNSSSNRENKSNSSGFHLESFFEVLLLSVYHTGRIFCGIHCNGHKLVSVVKHIPQLLEPCSTRFLLPPSSSWIDGAAVSLTADSSEGNWVATSHICFLQSDGVPNSTLRIVSSTNSSSTFSVPVSRHWGSSASVACLVNQSGLIETWARHPLPAVLYPVQNASIRLSAGRIRSGSAAQFALLASDWGNPPARHFCHLAERTLQQEPLQSSIEASTLWKFTPLDTDDGLRISCQLLQIAPNGLTVFNLLVVSGALNVLYEAQTEWTATQLQLLREGEHLAVSLKSLGGNPEPSHRCWQQTADGHVISVSHLLKQSRKVAQLETSFRVKAERWMNGGCVICKVIQKGLGDGERIFRKNLSVIFPSRVISWSGGLLNGSELNLTVETSEGNPRPMLSCSLSPGSFGSERLTVIPEPDRIGRNRGWIRRAQLTHRFTEQQAEVTVACLLSQPHLNILNLFPAMERKTFRAVFPSARWSFSSSGSGAIAALCCSLAAAVAVGGAVTAAVLKRMRAAAAAGRRDAMELPAAAKPADPNTVYYDEGN